jgi:aspartyl-tRNA(Asn)/glutamyl-tRNA(Gln) amidotransferase subunit B
MGLPWALPTLSEESVIKAAALWILLGCTQKETSLFDRKSYFYPDLPMGYQITQFTKPINVNGKVHYHTLDYSEEKEIGITQAHLECDTAKTTAVDGTLLLDYNRACTPLVEIVTGPDFHSADDVHGFIREIQRSLKYYSISNAEMDKWQMRCDVNISISKTGALGTKVEIKNMNSISAIKRAIAYEYSRQSTLLDDGQTIPQETRWWDDIKGISYSMRSKENSLDYRYFPEPDLPTLVYTTKLNNAAHAMIWETIAQKISRYKNTFGFNKEYINGILSDTAITHMFTQCIDAWHDPKLVAKYLVNYVLAYTNVGNLHISDTAFSVDEFMLFLDAVHKQSISDNIAKKIITQYLETRDSMQKVIDEVASYVQDDSAILQAIEETIATHDAVVQEYKNGKKTAIWFLIGQVMKKTWGQAAPQEVQRLFEERIG